MKSTTASPSAVLASFQIERTGQQIRVIDADGSVYQGQIADQVVMEKMQAPAGNAGANYASAGAAPGQPLQSNAKAQAPAVLGGFAFQVSGRNRTLNQNVTCAGNFFSAPLQQYANALKNSAGENQNLGANQPLEANNAQTLDNTQNYKNAQNYNKSQQNVLPKAQVWQVTGRVQVGPSNQFDLDAVTIQP